MKLRFTWVELLVVMIIIAISLAILIPVLNSYREADRTARCINNSHQIGQAFQTYAATFNNTFLPSAKIIKAPNGTQTVGGFSFLVKLQSFMEYESPYRSLPLTLPSGIDPEDISNQTIATQKTVAFHVLVDSMNTQISGFLCPSSPRGSAWRASSAQGITNYKAMGATTRGSLAMVLHPQATPPYGTTKIHPDGAIFPSTNNLPASDLLDGLSHTIITIETMDETASRWTVGKEATLVGLPQKSSPTGPMPQAPYNFFTPPGFVNDYNWDEKSSTTKAGLRTFLSYDFSPSGADAGKYEDPGFSKTPPAYGPSSAHPAVVICGFGDGSVQAISKQIDAANLFFLITKNNSDPFFVP